MSSKKILPSSFWLLRDFSIILMNLGFMLKLIHLTQIYTTQLERDEEGFVCDRTPHTSTPSI
jgi:hypothetical protein